MPVTDYVFTEETVLKKDFGTWLVNKMLAAGWQQVGSNPPPATGTPTGSQFYVMKGKRESDNMPTFVAINDFKLRTTDNSNYSMQLIALPMLDYTPGTPGQQGTTTQGGTPIANASSGNGSGNQYIPHIVGNYGDVFPLSTPITVRFCITPHNVTLICRVSPYFGADRGGYTFFGLPDILSKEKNSGATIMACSHRGTSAPSDMLIADTPLNIPSASTYTQIPAYSMSPPKSPDIHGNFPLMIVYGGDTTTGLRVRIPSVFFIPNGGLLDKDLIQIDNMTFEILVPAYRMTGGFLNGYVAYRIS